MDDKLIYLLAGLALGHILTRRVEQEEKKPVEPAFVPIPPEMLLQMQQMMNPPPNMQQAASEEQQGSAPPQKECTFRCWLCSGTTTFSYTYQPGPIQFQADCQRCGIENIIKLD